MTLRLIFPVNNFDNTKIMGDFQGPPQFNPGKKVPVPIMGLFSGTNNCHFLGTLEVVFTAGFHVQKWRWMVQIMFLSKWLIASVVGEPC